MQLKLNIKLKSVIIKAFSKQRNQKTEIKSNKLSRYRLYYYCFSLTGDGALTSKRRLMSNMFLNLLINFLCIIIIKKTMIQSIIFL